MNPFGKFVSVRSTPAPRTPTPPEREVGPADIRWGQASSFGTDDFRHTASNVGFHVEDKPKPTLYGTYIEEARKWTDFKVTNPEDNSQFVILRKLTEIAFKAVRTGITTEPRGEQVTFSFSNSAEVEGQPNYLKNEAGDDFQPLVLDPFHVAVEVGWGGPWALFVYSCEPTIAGFSPQDEAVFPRLYLNRPSSVGDSPSSNIFVEASAPEAEVYPRGETDIKNQWMKIQYFASAIGNNFGDTGPQRDVLFIAFFINLAKMRSALSGELVSQGDAYFELVWRFGGTHMPEGVFGPPIAKLGYGFYDASSLNDLETLNADVSNALAAMEPPDRTASSVMNLILTHSPFKQSVTITGSVDMTATRDALPTTETFYGDHYVFDDNYPNVIEDF